MKLKPQVHSEENLRDERSERLKWWLFYVKTYIVVPHQNLRPVLSLGRVRPASSSGGVGGTKLSYHAILSIATSL